MNVYITIKSAVQNLLLDQLSFNFTASKKFIETGSPVFSGLVFAVLTTCGSEKGCKPNQGLGSITVN